MTQVSSPLQLKRVPDGTWSVPVAACRWADGAPTLVAGHVSLTQTEGGVLVAGVADDTLLFWLAPGRPTAADRDRWMALTGKECTL